MKIRKLIIGLLIGLFVGLGIGFIVGGIAGRELEAAGYFGGDETTFYIANRDIRLEGGSTLAEGTKLRLDRYMPEGFVRLSLSVNTEEADAFIEQSGGRPNELSPIWTIGRAQQGGDDQPTTAPELKASVDSTPDPEPKPRPQ